ncbi:MAG: hypothetical protein V3S27_00920, partial [Kiloniellales bacterium]
MEPEVANPDEPVVAEGRHRRLGRFWTVVVAAATLLTVVLAVDQVRVVFGRQWLGGIILLTNHYLYAILGLLMPLVFLLFPAAKRARRDAVPWYDAALFALSFGACAYFFANSINIVDQGWEFVAPDHAIYMSYLLWLLVLEAARRAGGTALFAIVLS